MLSHFQKCDSCEILPPAPAQFADSSPEEMNKVSIWSNDETISMPVSWVKTSRCAGEWLNYFRARIMWSWRLTWRWQDFDFLSHSNPKIGQPTHWLLRTFHLCSFLSKATLAVLSLHFSSLDLWGAGRRIAAVGGSRKDKRGQMREKFLGKRKALGGKSQTSDTWCTIHICSPHFAFSQHNNHWFWLQF